MKITSKYVAGTRSVPNPEFNRVQMELRRAERELIISRDLLATRACSTQLLLTAPGVAKREQLLKLREHLTLQGAPIAGWVLLDTSLVA